MTRKKVKLAWIANNSARRASLKKRRLGLVKKVSELTTLCGIEACLIIYSPDEAEPLVWPSHAEVQRLLGKFHQMPELERLKKMTNLETYLKEKVTKSQEHLRKQKKKNKEVEIGHLMHQIDQGKGLDEFNLNELHGLTWLVEEKMTEIRKRIEFFQQVPFSSSAGPAHEYFPLPPQGPEDHDLTARIGGASAGLGVGGDGRITAESLLWDQWFNDMATNNEFKSGASSSSIRNDMGLPYYHPFAGTAADNLGLPPGRSFAGSSSVAADTGLPPFGNFSGPTTDTGMPHGSTVGGSNFGPFGSDMGPGVNPFGHVGSSSTGSELGGLPFGFFGGGSSSGAAGSDTPFDGKTWPPNFSP